MNANLIKFEQTLFDTKISDYDKKFIQNNHTTNSNSQYLRNN